MSMKGVDFFIKEQFRVSCALAYVLFELFRR